MEHREPSAVSRALGILKHRKVIALTASVVVAGGLVAAASGATGAFFSDTKSGTIGGGLGNISVHTWGGSGTDGLNMAFDDLLPGVPQTVHINYQNKGTAAEDVYLTFPNVPALHALNNLGTYGEVTITDSSTGQVFHSANLNDNRPDASGSCGPFSPTGCWPVPTQLLVRSNLAKGASGTVDFTFSYPGKLKSGQNGAFNPYPSNGAQGADAAGTPGNGLPFNVVATQVGQTPGN